MAGEWVDTTIGEQATLQRGIDITKADQRTGTVPVISSGGVSSYHDTAAVTGPGVILGRKGVVGSVYFTSTDYWPHDTTLWVKDFHGNDCRFVYYFFKWMAPRIARMDVGSANPTLNRNHVHPIEIRWPPTSEQGAIAHILGTLDDKIELNRRMNETLEEMARSLFKSWFVDFDPVRAKAEGGDPGLPKPLADLFPNSFEDSELGEIPKGWEVGTLGDVAEHPRRGVQPIEIEPATPYIALEHMPKRCIALSEWGTGEGLESNKFSFKRGEILFGKLRPYFHKVGVAPVDGVCSTDIVVVAPRESVWFGFVLGHVSSDAFVEYTNAGSTGTKMPRTSWSEMARYPVAIPPKEVSETLTNQIRPFSDRVIASIHESRTLAALRDTLLPKLISGDLRVRIAERCTETVQ
jgi:type I restriction enzyme S subunit